MEKNITDCHTYHHEIINACTITTDEDMYLTGCLLINGDLTVNGTLYNVKSISDLSKIDCIDKTIIFDKINLDNISLIHIEDDVVINGNFIMCEELGYVLTVNGSMTVLDSVNI